MKRRVKNLLVISLVTGSALAVSRPVPWSGATAQPGARDTLNLGDSTTLAHLFSFPNDSSTLTLAATIEHYLSQSITRDSLRPTTARVSGVTVAKVNDRYVATLTGPPAATAAYKSRIRQFLAIGKVGYDSAVALARRKAVLRRGEDSTPIWQTSPPLPVDSQWCFFLPVGLALQNALSVQLLHYPPNYTLLRRDYLGAQTDKLWEGLLMENGVRAADLPLYEHIVDIAPVAKDGKLGDFRPSAVYGAFRPYAKQMLQFALSTGDTTARVTRPLVTYGAQPRDFLNAAFRVESDLKLWTDTIRIVGARVTPVLVVPHPSSVYQAVEKNDPKNPPDPKTAFALLRTEIVAACWQARMARNLALSTVSVVQACSKTWSLADSTKPLCRIYQELIEGVYGGGQPIQCASAAGPAATARGKATKPQASTKPIAGLERPRLTKACRKPA